MTEGNGEFKGSTVARLDRIEADIKEVKADAKEVKGDVRLLKERQDKFLGVIAVGAFAVPFIVRMLWP